MSESRLPDYLEHIQQVLKQLPAVRRDGNERTD